MSGCKLYADALSPVCRSVMLFLSMNNIPHELVHVSLKDRELMPHSPPLSSLTPPLPGIFQHCSALSLLDETRTNPELFAINPNRKVPALNDNGFTMFER